MKKSNFPIIPLLLMHTFSVLFCADESKPETIPFRLHGGHMIIVAVRIGPLADLNFLIDTGASVTVLNRSVAKKLGLEGEELKVTVYGREEKVRMAQIKNVTIGNRIFADVRVQIAPLSFHGMDHQIRIDGLIGLDLMRRTSLNIDFEACQITLGSVTHTETSFPFYGRLPIIPVPLEVGDQRLSLLLDTGAEHLILYERRIKGIKIPKTGEKIGIICVGRKAELKQVQLSKVRLGLCYWENFEAYMLDVRCPETSPDGILGVASLGLKQLNLDFQNNIVSWSL